MAGEKGGKKGEGQGVCVGEGGKYIIYSHGNIYEMCWCVHRGLTKSSCPDTVSNEQTVRTWCLCKWIWGLDLLPIPKYLSGILK